MRVAEHSSSSTESALGIARIVGVNSEFRHEARSWQEEGIVVTSSHDGVDVRSRELVMPCACTSSI